MISFRTMFTHLEERVGRHCLPLNQAAATIDQLLEEGSGHHALVKTTIKQLYTTAGCSSLDEEVRLYPILDGLGEVRHALQENGGDVDQLSLVERIGEEVVALFRAKGLLSDPPTPPALEASVIPLRQTPSLKLPRTAG